MSDHKLEEELKISCAEPEFKAAAVETVAEQDQSGAVPGAEPEACRQSSPLSDAWGIPAQLGEFKLLELISEGALGKVLKAENPSLAGSFAARVFAPTIYPEPKDIERLLSGFKTASEFSDPHLASYYHYGCTENGHVYLISDLQKGKSLAERVALSESFEPGRVIDIARQICLGLKYLHERQFVHGNLKPSNVFLDEINGHEFVKLGDFSLMGNFSEEMRYAYMQRAARYGAANYMSPEQVLNYPLDARSDLYSLGLIIYELLSGKPRVSGQSQIENMMKQVHGANESVGLRDLDLPPVLEKILNRCLEKNRSARYFSVEDLELDLNLASAEIAENSVFASVGIRQEKKEKNENASEKGRRRRRRRKLIIYGVLGALAFSGLTFAAINRQDSSYFENQAEIALNNAISSPMADAESLAVDPPPPPVLDPDGIQFNQFRQTFSPVQPFEDRAQQRWQQRQFEKAEKFAKRAILAYRFENPLRSDNKFKHRLSDLQMFLGELYLRDQFAEQGGRLDRSTFMSVSDVLELNGGLSALRLYPSFPGLFPSQRAADYKDAEIWLEKAAKTLKRKYCGDDVDLLWDLAYTKFQLGKIGDAISVHEKLLTAISDQSVPDKNSLVMVNRNIGLLYLWNGNWGQAVHHLKAAGRLDGELNKIPGLYSDQIRVELAYAFLKEGKFDVAEKLARENLFNLETRGLSLAQSDSQTAQFNFKVLAEALRQQGNISEAQKFELQGLPEFEPGAAMH